MMGVLVGCSLGRYHIMQQLGEGGMAIVYRAYDTRLDVDVAVKVIRTELFPPALLEHVLRQFEREAKALARLTHPNIVKVTDYGEYEGRPYIVMEYLPGGTLKKLLKERDGKPFPWHEAIRLLLPVARALHFAHEHGFIHRDVKPSNILFTESGEPMLSDFGIAKILGSEETMLSGTGVGIGTPEYMAPEQAMGQPVDGRVDVYALGVVFYELVVGRRPYEADTPMAVALKHVNEPLPRPREMVPDLPDKVEKFLYKALAKAPEDRFPDMGTVVTALERLLLISPPAFEDKGEYIGAREEEESPAVPARKPVGWLWATAILMLVGVLLAVWLSRLTGSVPWPPYTPYPTQTPYPTYTPYPTETPRPTGIATPFLRAQVTLQAANRHGAEAQYEGTGCLCSGFMVRVHTWVLHWREQIWLQVQTTDGENAWLSTDPTALNAPVAGASTAVTVSPTPKPVTNRIAFCSAYDGNWIYVMNAVSSVVTRLTYNQTDDGAPNNSRAHLEVSDACPPYGNRGGSCRCAPHGSVLRSGRI